MNIFKALTAKPWLPEAGPAYAGVHEFSAPPQRIAVRMLLGVVSALFFLLAIAYLSRSQVGDWRALAGEPFAPLSDPARLWVNTALLLLSSIAFHGARRAVRRGSLERTRLGLALAGLFAVAFLVGQVLFWQQLAARGYFLAANPANAFFYLITGLHGLHLLGGLVAWGITARRAWRSTPALLLRLPVELCSLYWHFLFVVWLAMFALLASPQATLGTLAALCGIS